MKIILVFSPWCNFSYLPIGVGYIKGYIQKYLPGADITSIDLNNIFFNSFADVYFQMKKICKFCPVDACKRIILDEKFADGIKGVRISIKLLRDPGLFNNPFFFNQCSRKVRIYHDIIKKCIDHHLNAYLAGKISSKKLPNLLHKDAERVLAGRPDIIGFSIFSTEQLLYSLALAKLLKERNKRITVVFGGAAIAHLDYKKILEIFYPVVNYIIIKEGEMPFLGLIKFLSCKEKEAIRDVPNLVYSEKGIIKENKTDFIQDINSISFPDYSDFNLSGYFSPYVVMPILFSRGCYWNQCTFCSHHNSYAKYRSRSVDDVVAEIKQWVKKGVKFFWFADETIFYRDVKLLAEALTKSRIKIFYHMMLRPEERLTDIKTLKKLYSSGLRMVIWGIESFSPKIIKLMNKGTKPEVFAKILKNSSLAGISNLVYLMQNFPLQSTEDMINDISAIQANKKYIDSITIHNFWLEKGAYIHNHPEKFGLYDLRERPLAKNIAGFIPTNEIEFKSRMQIDRSLISRMEKNIYPLNQFKDAWNDILIHAALIRNY